MNNNSRSMRAVKVCLMTPLREMPNREGHHGMGWWTEQPQHAGQLRQLLTPNPSSLW